MRKHAPFPCLIFFRYHLISFCRFRGFPVFRSELVQVPHRLPKLLRRSFFVPSRIKNQIINLKNPVFPQFFDGFVDVSTAIINSNNREREQTHPPTPDSPRIGELKGERRER